MEKEKVLAEMLREGILLLENLKGVVDCNCDLCTRMVKRVEKFISETEAKMEGMGC